MSTNPRALGAQPISRTISEQSYREPAPEPSSTSEEETDAEPSTNTDEELGESEESGEENMAEATENAITTTATPNVKSLVPDPGFFDGTRSKFDDWWRNMKLFLRFNKVTSADDKAIAIIARMRGGTAGAFGDMKFREMEDDDDAIDWDEFADELEKTFSDDALHSRAQWDIEKFKQRDKHTADFLIEFEVLKARAKTDDTHAMFLLKKNVRQDIIRTIMGYPPKSIPKSYEEWKETIMSVGQGYEATDQRAKDKKTATGVTYGGMGQPMEIGRTRHIFNDKGEPKCYNCGVFGHIAKDCSKPKQITCYNCGKNGHIAKECRGKKVKFTQKFKIRGIDGNEGEATEGGEEKQDFPKGSE